MRGLHTVLTALVSLFALAAPARATDPSRPKDITFALLSTENVAEITRRSGPVLTRLEKDPRITGKSATATDYRGTIETLKFDEPARPAPARPRERCATVVPAAMR